MTTDDSPEPALTCTRRRDARQAQLKSFERREGVIANARLVVAIAAIALALAAWRLPAVSTAWLGVPAVLFLALVVAHDRVLERIGRLRHGVRFYSLALGRMAGQADDQAPTGVRFSPADHPFAADLDLFGEGSLFSLLCTCRTTEGEATLARWLLSPAPPDVVRARQRAVAELAPRLDLREALFALASEARSELPPDRLALWGRQPGQLAPGLALPLGALSAAGLVALVAWVVGPFGVWPLIGVATLQALVTFALRRPTAAVLRGVEQPGRELRGLARLLARFEAEPVTSAGLVALQATLRGSGRAASVEIERLGRLIEVAEARSNQLFAPVAFVLGWGPLCALAVERWRRRCGGALERWSAALGEVEALASFGAYAFEHPHDVFCDVAPTGPLYEAEGLAHPLIAPATAVRNDLHLGDPARVLMVSGSNMSGKSTLLRAVGVSVSMGLAGCPVRATRLTLSPLVLGACLHLVDSLQHGTSRFFAEIRRHKQILDAADAGSTVLFLLDEILHGTNSRDRRVGAEALVAALLQRGAIGLMTTHDLAVTELVHSLGDRGRNAHFVDHVTADGKLSFDYRLRPGVVDRSNALQLMRAIGLPV